MRARAARRTSGSAGPTNFLFYILFIIAVCCGWINRFLASTLWPLLLLGLAAQWGLAWLHDARSRRLPPASARTDAAVPATKEELKGWLLFNTHLSLPAEDMPLDYYQALYEKALAQRGGPPAPAAAPGSRGPAAIHIRADGQATTEAIPPLGVARWLGALGAGCVLGAVLSCVPPPSWCAALRAHHGALDPAPWLRGLGAAVGVWLVGSLPPHRGPLGDPLRCACLASAAFDLCGTALAYHLLLPLYVRVLPPRSFPMLLPLVSSALLPIAASLLAPAAAAAWAFARAVRLAPPPRGSARRRAARRLALLLLGGAAGGGALAAALHAQGELGRAAQTGRLVLRGELGAAWRLLCEAGRARGWHRPPPGGAVAQRDEDEAAAACRVLRVPGACWAPPPAQAEVKRAYRALALEHHPDKQPRDASEEEREAAAARFREAQEAYETLARVHGWAKAVKGGGAEDGGGAEEEEETQAAEQ